MRQRRSAPKINQQHQKARVEYSAGGIVFRRTKRGILVGLIKDSYHKWTFPKGHVEPGETVEQAAVRETSEEMGIRRLRIIAPLGKTSIWFRDRYEHVGSLVHKYITYYLMEAPPFVKGKSQISEHVYAINWVPFRRVPEKVSYKNMQKIVSAAVQVLSGLKENRHYRDQQVA